MNSVLFNKVSRVVKRKAGAWVGGAIYSVEKTLGGHGAAAI